MSASSRPRRTRAKQPFWADYNDAELLELRLCDLGVSLERTWLEGAMDDLHAELERRGIVARAHAWLSDEWFSPHDTSGIAIPFYLAHPRLMRLERKMTREVEGGTKRECMRILRHEMGHVMQRAYGLHRRKSWRDQFGPSSIPYPDHYRPNPLSRRYVQHLKRWYAQSHPDEDFAETFAVWLSPRGVWKRQYEGWGALNKLTYVDELMEELAGVKPAPRPRFVLDPLSSFTKTLAQHYKEKCAKYAVDAPTVFDRDLRRIFADTDRSAPSAAAFIRSQRAGIRRAVARWPADYAHTLDAMIDDIAERARVMGLRATGAERTMRLQVAALLSRKAVQSLYSAQRRQSFAV